jgi:hypothetical protein
MVKGLENFTHKKNFIETQLKQIICGILECCEITKKLNIKLENKEEIIRNHLYIECFNNDIIMEKSGLENFRFEPEIPENYNSDKKPIGRVDLKIYSIETFKTRKSYFIIECKRIDGSSNLNNEYINEGVSRFITKKYSSSLKKNVMFGFVVKKIEIGNNAEKISQKEKEKFKRKVKNSFVIEKMSEKHKYIYKSDYLIDNSDLSLYHIFYDFSAIIK